LVQIILTVPTAHEHTMAGGGYQMGYTLTPLMEDGGLDTSGDFKGGPHPAKEDTLYKLCVSNRDAGNKLVQEGQYEGAIAKYSELIMQSRALDNETDVQWTDEDRDDVRKLRAAAYLNLSLCFLKTQQWTHANNTATRAIQGDKDPADPKDDVLEPAKKAKALYRRALVQSEGFTNFENAVKDLRHALELVPSDKTVQAELKKAELALKKASKASDQKFSGFFSKSTKVQSGEGIFSETERQRMPEKEPSKEPMKLSDGLFIVPTEQEEEINKNAEGGYGNEADVNYDELSRELNELREDKPEVYSALKDKIGALLQDEASPAENGEATAEDPAGVR